MDNFLSKADIKLVVKIGKYILKIFAVVYLLLAILMLVLENTIPAIFNLMLCLIYFVFYKKYSKFSINRIIFIIHFVSISYASFMIFYFDWSIGAQYFILPCIAFCYVGEFKNKANAYILAIAESIVFELLYVFSVIKGYSLKNTICFKDYCLNDIFYIAHSFIICLVIVGVVYFLKIRMLNMIDQKEKLNSYLSKDVFHDPLTTLLNRWAMIEKISHIKDFNQSSFIILDIDHFKKINDTYGHNVGDEVLKRISIAIKEVFFNHTNMLARWGGEEFLIYLNNSSKEDLLKLCDTFRANLSKLEFEPDGFKITVSIGYFYKKDNFVFDDFTSLVKKADELLYKAKNNGRDRIEYGEE